MPFLTKIVTLSPFYGISKEKNVIFATNFVDISENCCNLHKIYWRDARVAEEARLESV